MTIAKPKMTKTERVIDEALRIPWRICHERDTADYWTWFNTTLHGMINGMMAVCESGVLKDELHTEMLFLMTIADQHWNRCYDEHKYQ